VAQNELLSLVIKINGYTDLNVTHVNSVEHAHIDYVYINIHSVRLIVTQRVYSSY
jgi:hypothetical protein